MKPTIGRIVRYRTTEEDRESMRKNHQNVQEELPAIIVAVWSDTCVNLKVLLDGEGDMWVTSSSQGNDEMNWNWFEIKK